MEGAGLTAVAAATLVACGGGDLASTSSTDSKAASASGPTVTALRWSSGSTTTTTAWSWLADEGQTMSLASSTLVRFGYGDKWSQKYVQGSVPCSVTTFGDPAVGATKSCQTQLPLSGPVSGVLVGQSTIQSNIDTNPAGMAEAFVYKAQSTGTVDTLNVYLDGTSAATTVVAGLYSDANGVPGKLLASATITKPKAGAWNAVTLPATSVVSGVSYWIALLNPPSTGTLRFRDVASGGGGTFTSAQSSLTQLPTSWTVGTRYANSPASAYLNYV
ncbi:MAG: hypothetical protein EBS16_10350, partial [Betaproteobacteria bacterium]|nr:hypothetical protein [Betaproteobacteria bacterium]